MGASGVILQPGDVFAEDFRIVTTTESGGREAYVVEQLSTGKQRILRLMPPDLVADEGRRARFEQEARVGSRIESPHVIDVVAAGVDGATGTPWLVRELLSGEDVAALVKRDGALAAPMALEILEQVIDAVGAAHAAGIVHGDLGPENVFLADAAAENTKYLVKVLDFGIARLAQEPGPEPGPHVGGAGPEADVRSIGLLAFHLLTGKSFEPEEGKSASTPEGFEAWLARSTDREAGARFPDVRAQGQALRSLLGAATPVAASEPAIPSPAEPAAEPPVASPAAAPASPGEPSPTASPPPPSPTASPPPPSPTGSPARPSKTRAVLLGALALAAVILLSSSVVVRRRASVPTATSTEGHVAASVASVASSGEATPVAPASDADASQPAPEADASGDDAATSTAATLPSFAHRESGRALNIAECTAGPRLTEDEVRAIVNRNSGGLKQACWDKSPLPSLIISETVHVVICGTGAVQTVTASGNDSVGRCIENAVKGWRFPAGGTIDIPFRFSRDFVPSGPIGPGPFDRGAAYGALGSIDVQSCKRGDSGPGHVKITFAPSGQVTDAVVDAPPFAGTAVGSCVSAKLHAARIPPFLGPAVTLGKSFTIN